METDVRGPANQCGAAAPAHLLDGGTGLGGDPRPVQVGGREARQGDCAAASPKVPGTPSSGNPPPLPDPAMPPWGRPSFRRAESLVPVKGREGARRAEGGSRPHSLRTARSAVPGAPAHSHPGRREGGAALTSSTDTPPIPRARGGGRTGSTGQTHGRTRTEGRAHGQAMPGEAARAELLLPEAGGPGSRTGEAARFAPRASPPPLGLSLSPVCVCPHPVLSAP